MRSCCRKCQYNHIPGCAEAFLSYTPTPGPIPSFLAGRPVPSSHFSPSLDLPLEVNEVTFLKDIRIGSFAGPDLVAGFGAGAGVGVNDLVQFLY